MKRLAGVLAAALFALATTACGQTDAGITTAIKAKFVGDDLVKAYDINVTTQDKVVTLEGEVATGDAKERAIDLARATEGVRDVNDRLDVRELDRDLGEDIERGLDATGDAIKDGAEATADAATKAGRAVRDAVTDRDRDTDKDGK